MIRAWLVVLAACATTQTSYNTQTDLAGTTPVARLVLFEQLERDGFSPVMREGFRQTVVGLLADCGVTSAFYADVETLDEIQPPPEATLTILPSGGTVVKHVDQHRHERGESNDRYYTLEMFDRRAKKITWQAKTRFVFAGTSGMSTGSDFAIGLVTQLRDDGVLPSCPKGELQRSSRPRR